MTARLKALVLCCPSARAASGRILGLYRELTRHYDVTLLTFANAGGFDEIRHGASFRELRFPRDELWRNAFASLERSGVGGDLSGLASALAVAAPACALRQAAHVLAAAAEVVIHDYPYSAPIFDAGAGPREHYRAHGVEAATLSLRENGRETQRAFQMLYGIEGDLVRRACRVLAPNATDAETFRLLYGVDAGRLGICPFGFSQVEFALTAQERAAEIARPRLLFAGGVSLADLEAVAHLSKLALDLPECEVLVAGDVRAAAPNWRPPANVRELGDYAPGNRLALFSEANIAINPRVLGGGCDRTVETLVCALPTIATPEAVRDLDLMPGVHAEIVSRDDMPAAIRALFRDCTRRGRLAVAGRDYARERFAWRRIADDLAAALGESPSVVASDRPFVLALNDYPVDWVRSGGATRIRALLGALDCDIVLVTFGATCEAVLLDQGILQLKVEKTATHRDFEAIVNDDHPVSVSDGVASLFVAENPALLHVVKTLAARAAAVILEHPYMAPALEAVLSVRRDMPVVYSAHNAETAHKAKLLAGHPFERPFALLVEQQERVLLDRCNLVVCCSPADAEQLRGRGAPVVAANGCSLPDLSGLGDYGQRVGFLGSRHPPNIAAARFIRDDLTPLFPGVRFEFVGAVCEALAPHPGDNVVLHGALSDRAKSEVMRKWTLALNPVEVGGGSSVKLADYLAHGLATLNTATGARGFAVEANDAGLVVDLSDFATALADLLADRATLARLGANARAYAERELSWRATTAAYREALWRMLARRRAS